MNLIRRATGEDTHILKPLATQTFIESHGHSASGEDIRNYIAITYSQETVFSELTQAGNLYYLLFHENRAAGFSKIILDHPFENSTKKNITKLERIYILKEFYDLHFGQELLNFNIDLSKQNAQAGMWLYVWIENERAFRFYNKNGFRIVGSHDYRISATHTNPNHLMYLEY